MDFFTLVGLSASFYFFIYIICLWFNDCDLELAFTEKFGKKLVKLSGKVVWITGASSDLGKMMALRVAKEHGKLVLSSNSVKELDYLKAVCLKINKSLSKQDILVLPFDITACDTHRSCFEKVIKHFGIIDIVIINEDKWQKDSWEYTVPSTERVVFQTNVFGVLSLSRLAVQYFTYKKKGKLAITSSIAGVIGVPYSGCYSASKHALHGYYNGLRIEKLAEKIQITLLCLGSNESSQDKPSKLETKFSDSGITTHGPTKKMSAERSAFLCLIAIVNNLDEAWIAVFPILPLVYGLKFYPNVTKWMLKYLKSSS